MSLEPCCHEGKTPPCTDAILAAGHRARRRRLRRPDREGRGRGLGILRDEGVEVDVAGGELAARGAAAEPGLPQARAHRAPVGALQVGDDARRQGRDADRRLEVDLRRVQPRPRPPLARRRSTPSRSGIGTALADDPQLTARVDGVRHQPRAWSSTRPPACRWTPSSSRPRPRCRSIVVVSRAAPRSAAEALENAGAEVIVATGENEPARVRSALDQLGDAGAIASILLEGGPHLAGAFFDAGEIDEVRLFLAPLLLGGRSARDPLEGEGVERDLRRAARR